MPSSKSSLVDPLECSMMHYAWGSRTALAELSRRPSPTDQPEAELWMGAHPLAPSRVTRDGRVHTLDSVITDNPTDELGARITERFGPRLPFLLKVLAAAEPLSLQVHPNANQAKEGFDNDNARGIAPNSPVRNYKDAWHKPELLCALQPVQALCGFRSIADTLRLFDDLGVADLEAFVALLRHRPNAEGLRAMFQTLMQLPVPEAARLVHAASDAAQARQASSPFARELGWLVRLAEAYPSDVGVVTAMLLNLIELNPGEALYLKACTLHAYLEGVGIEIMASSDNVLRGGLTRKHIDVPELLRILDFSDGPTPIVAAEPLDAYERVWRTPSEEFQLSAIDLEPHARVTRTVRGPELLLCTAQAMTITAGDSEATMTLRQGESAYVPARAGHYTLCGPADAARATVFRATTNV